MKKYLSLILAILMAFCFSACGEEKKVITPEPEAQESSAVTEATDYEADYIATITVKNYGKIVVELYGDLAPITVKNFVKLANEKFYDGLTFHRIMEGFMIQGGDPDGNGMGGSDEEIKGEFSANGVENGLKHTRGVISMARSGSQYEQYIAAGYKLSDLPAAAKSDMERAFNSASSQFFIMHKDTPSLDGSYAAFGKTISGIEVVDAIAQEAIVTDNSGTVEAENQPIIESVRVKEV